MRIAPMSLLLLKLRGAVNVRWDDYLHGRMIHSNWVSNEHFYWLTGNMNNMGIDTVLYNCKDWSSVDLVNFANEVEHEYDFIISPIWPNNVNELDDPYLIVSKHRV